MSNKRAIAVSLASVILCILVIATFQAFISGIAECIIDVPAQVWLDENGNGLWDEGEPPLPGVRVELLDEEGTPADGGATNWRGEVTLEYWYAGSTCRLPSSYIVKAVEPAGYQPSTAELQFYRRDETALFGFTYLPGAPTVTPRPPAPRCTTFTNLPALSADLAIAPSGIVWASTYRGLLRVDPEQNKWKTYSTADGLPSNRIQNITLVGEQTIWVTTWDNDGAARFDGRSWQIFTTADGLISNEVNDVIVMDDSTVWFGTDDGVTLWEENVNRWTSFARGEAIGDIAVRDIRASAADTIWFADFSAVTRLKIDQETGELAWQTFGRRDLGFPHSVSFDEMAVDAAGRIWFDGVVYFDPVSETFQKSVYGNLVSALTISEDGGLWLGTDYDGAIFIPDPLASPEVDWQLYDVRDGLVAGSIQVIALGADHSAWFATSEGLAHCQIDTGP